MVKNYHYSNKGITGYNGKDLLKIPISQAGELSTETRHVFLAIYNNLSIKTNDDSANALRLVNAIDEAEDKEEIVIGEGVYDWLKKKLEEPDREGFLPCPRLFRHNGGVVYEFIKDGYEKPHQPSSKKKGEEGKDDSPAE